MRALSVCPLGNPTPDLVTLPPASAAPLMDVCGSSGARLGGGREARDGGGGVEGETEGGR